MPKLKMLLKCLKDQQEDIYSPINSLFYLSLNFSTIKSSKLRKSFITLFCIFSLSLISHHLFAQANQVTFNYTGATEEFIVPANVYSLSITATGGAGGTGNRDNTVAAGGLGAEASAVFAVIPGDILTVAVAQGGVNGVLRNSGGGGGGGSFIVGPGGVLLLSAGGGGGGGCSNAACVPGLDGQGFAGTGTGGAGSNGGGGAGFNGNGTAGTGGATGGSSYANGLGGGSAGDESQGVGGFGGGGGGRFYGGGGGGYSGGDGAVFGGAAGGGTSYVDASGTEATATSGSNPGNGQIVISYSVAVPTLSQWGIIILLLLFLIFAVGTASKRYFSVA